MPFNFPFRKGKKNIDVEALRPQIIEAIRTVYDPEIPVNVYELGLIYEVNISPEAHIDIKMTLTTPNCPEAQTLPGRVEQAAKGVAGVKEAIVEIVWDPPWTQDRMTDVAKLELGLL
jgi:FeS assembly SUF system protein